MFMKWGVPFRPPTLPSSLDGGHFLNTKTNSLTCLVATPLLWDMKDLFGNTKEPWWYSMTTKIKKWWLYLSPNYVSITTTIMDLSGAMITLSNSLDNRSGSDGTNATPENGGANPYIGKQCPLPTFNPIMDFFCKLWWNYHGV